MLCQTGYVEATSDTVPDGGGIAKWQEVEQVRKKPLKP